MNIYDSTKNIHEMKSSNDTSCQTSQKGKKKYSLKIKIHGKTYFMVCIDMLFSHENERISGIFRQVPVLLKMGNS